MNEQSSPGDAVGMSSQLTKGQTSSSKWRQLLPSPTSILLLIFFIMGLLMNGGFNPATRRGFFCNDSTIQYPFKQDTVSFKVLLVIAMLMPSLVIKLSERKLSKALESFSSASGASCRKDSNICLSLCKEEDAQLMTPTSGVSVKRRLVVNDDNDPDLEAVDKDIVCDISFSEGNDPTSINEEMGLMTRIGAVGLRKAVREFSNLTKAFSDLQLFLFGFTTTMFLTGVGKMTCGRFRPHFMELCKPDVDCSLPNNLYKYIRDFKCTNEALRPRDFAYITTSWPSGHASIVFFAMLYLILYMNTIITTLMSLRSLKRPPRVGSNLLFIYSIYVLMVGLAAFVALTRVSDYHHHPLDVLSGCILGIITAIVTAKFVLEPRFAPITNLLECKAEI